MKEFQMRHGLRAALSAAVVAAPLILVASQAGSSVAASSAKPAPVNQTIKIAGKQTWCGTDGWECAEPLMNWDEFAGYKQAIKNGARNFLPYIGHDEPSTLFYSNQPGAGNNVTYQLTLPKEPPTRPKQNGSGGTDSFILHPTFWFGMVMCDPNGNPNPDGAALTGHPTVPCKPDSDSNIYQSLNPKNSHYIGLGPGQAFQALQL